MKKYVALQWRGGKLPSLFLYNQIWQAFIFDSIEKFACK